MNAPLSTVEIRRQVAFSETDAAGIVHFSNFFRYMEAAELAFFEQLGAPLLEERAGVLTGWPRVSVSCEFLAPLRFPEHFRVRLTAVEKRTSRLRFRCEIYRDDPAGPTLLARGTLTTVRARLERASGEMKACPMPDFPFDVIRCAPDEAGATGPA